MSNKKCGCVIADHCNTSAVRNGYELGGYIKTRCNRHQKEWDERLNNTMSNDKGPEKAWLGKLDGEWEYGGSDPFEGAVLYHRGDLVIPKPDEQDGWISVDTPPKDIGHYQVFLESPEKHGTDRHTAKFDGNKFFVIGHHFHFDMPPVTHWRNLPSPPKQIKGGA